jgi:hypothetical protein
MCSSILEWVCETNYSSRQPSFLSRVLAIVLDFNDFTRLTCAVVGSKLPITTTATRVNQPARAITIHIL